MTLLGYGAFFHTSPVMNSVYTIVSGGPPYQVGPYAGPSRGVFYELRVARSDVVSLSLSRRNAASESAKKAVARGSWLVKAHHHSEWAVVKYHSGPPSHGRPFWQPSCAFRWSAPDGPKRLSGRPLRTRPIAVFFCGPHSFPSPVCDIVGDVLIKASRCESWVGPFWDMGLFFTHHPS